MPTLEVSSGALLVVLYGYGIGYESYNTAEGGGEWQKPAVGNSELQVFLLLPGFDELAFFDWRILPFVG